jgi:uncharacterized radical SAM superfamily Fe-S cluster-containing enzyme
MKTLSICNTCYKKIPATISFINEQVVLSKKCCGKVQQEVIEKDVGFYELASSQKFNNILGGYCNIAITEKCNTSCKACYCSVGVEEKSGEEINLLARSAPGWINKFMLTGGEPTVHSQFFDIISSLNCGVITNGINFSDMGFLKEFSKHSVYTESSRDEMAMMFSLNVPGSKDFDKRMTALNNMRVLGLKVGIISATITDLEEIPSVLNIFMELKDIGNSFKIRPAFNIGQSQGFKQIYLSEMVKKVQESVGLMRFLGDRKSVV